MAHSLETKQTIPRAIHSAGISEASIFTEFGVILSLFRSSLVITHETHKMVLPVRDVGLSIPNWALTV